MAAGRVNHPTVEAWHNVDRSQTFALRACRLFKFPQNTQVRSKTVREQKKQERWERSSYLSGCFFSSEAEAWWWWADAESSASPNSEHLFQYSWHYIIARRAGSARRWGCTQRSPLIGAWHARSLNSDWMRPLGQRCVYFLIRLLNWPWFGRLLIYFLHDAPKCLSLQ